MNRRRPIALAATVIIGGITTFLLYRLSTRPVAPTTVSAPVASPPAPAKSVAQLPTVLPTIDENSALPVAWSADSDMAPSPRWKIALERYDSNANRSDIWVANGDGSGGHRVLTDATSPCWSPKRRMLAFARQGNVWVANADGSDARQLTFWIPATGDKAMTIHGIAWNGHDNVLSFSREETYNLTNEDGGNRDDIFGSTIYHLALKPTANSRATEATPFAPVLYETPTCPADTGNRDIWRRTPPRFDITEHHGRFNFVENEYPAWSPSGTKMAFVRAGDVWLAEAEDEKNDAKGIGGYAQDWYVSRLAACAQYDGHTVGSSHWIIAATGIAWSPDESWLVYGARRISGSGADDLHILRRDKDTWKDTQLPTAGDSPSISPDGRWILYISHGDLRAMTPDGKKQISLIKSGNGDWYESAVW